MLGPDLTLSIRSKIAGSLYCLSNTPVVGVTLPNSSIGVNASHNTLRPNLGLVSSVPIWVASVRLPNVNPYGLLRILLLPSIDVLAHVRSIVPAML